MGKQISHLIKNHFTSSYGEGCFEGVAGRADDTFFILGVFYRPFLISCHLIKIKNRMTLFSKRGIFIDPFEFYVIEKVNDTFSKKGSYIAPFRFYVIH